MRTSATGQPNMTTNKDDTDDSRVSSLSASPEKTPRRRGVCVKRKGERNEKKLGNALSRDDGICAAEDRRW